MKSYYLAALFLSSLSGCGGPTTLSKTVHLKVQRDPANDDNRQETVITFHSPPKAEIVVETGRDHDSITFDAKTPNGDRKCTLRLIAKREERQEDGKSKVEIVIRQELPNGDSAGGPSMYTVDADKPLITILDVTATEGDFPLEEPIKLGTLNGMPIRLVVRRVQN